MPETKLVTIERSRYSSYFQVTRAWLSAASALVAAEPSQAVEFIDAAIRELRDLRSTIMRAAR